MPYIYENGELRFVTQAEIEAYNQANPVGQSPDALFRELQQRNQAGTVPAGGNIVNITPNQAQGQVPQEILIPNTTNTSPNQTLPVSNQPFTSTPAPAENLQVVTQSNTAPSVRDFTETEKAWLGGADPTDTFVLARMDAALGNPPAASEVQTLSGAIGNINFGNIGNTVGNLTSSFGNSVGDFFSGTSNTVGNLASSFGNSVSEFFTSTSNAAPSASSLDTAPAEVTPGVGTGSAAYDVDGNLLPGYQLSETNDPVFVGGNADTPEQTIADTTVPVSAEEGYYQQFVAAFQQEQDAPTPTDSPYAPVAVAGDTPLVEAAGTVTVESAGAEFDNATPIETTADAVPVDPADDPTADGAFVETSPGVFQAAEDLPVDPADDPTADGAFVEQADGSFVAAEDLPVDPADDPTVDGAFVEQADGSFVAAEDLPVDPATDPTAGGAFVEQADGSFVAAEDLPLTDINGEPASPTEDPNVPEEVGDDGGITDQQLFDNEAATGAANARDRAQQQQTLRQQQALKQTSNDWRVKLSLAKNADYLYNAADPGILKPLSSKSGTSGVVFPYTPAINTNYRADYSPYTLTHSNYKGYFYNSSYMDAINITATFTAQDTLEAEYLLAVIHFFRSVTKMFYGQDTQRGSPPPLVFLSGLGEYQFNQHPCVVSQFNYNLPADVDYIRATSIVNQGISFNNVRSNQSSPVSGLAGVSRLANALLPKGAKASPPAPQPLGKNNSTYVPTKMEMTITLLPVQSRNQVSKVFKLSSYANGNQLKGGFW